MCTSVSVVPFLEIEGKTYWRCDACLLTFLDHANHPPPAIEYAHYLTHENSVDDPGYRAFLARLAVPLLDRLAPGSQGLDYGCGPGPALAHMLREAGHSVALFDPYFAPDKASLSVTYDFITCTETIEHFYNPRLEFARFDKLLRPGGWLGLMTGFLNEDAVFANWYYRRDPTHVAFYKAATLAFVAGSFGWHFENPAKDIALMQKSR